VNSELVLRFRDDFLPRWERLRPETDRDVEYPDVEDGFMLEELYSSSAVLVARRTFSTSSVAFRGTRKSPGY
jgi:hypothetical protein